MMENQICSAPNQDVDQGNHQTSIEKQHQSNYKQGIKRTRYSLSKFPTMDDNGSSNASDNLHWIDPYTRENNQISLEMRDSWNVDLGHIRISDNIVDIPLPEKILETEFDESAEESTITIPRISIYYSSSGHSSSYEGSSDDSYQSSNVQSIQSNIRQNILNDELFDVIITTQINHSEEEQIQESENLDKAASLIESEIQYDVKYQIQIEECCDESNLVQVSQNEIEEQDKKLENESEKIQSQMDIAQEKNLEIRSYDQDPSESNSGSEQQKDESQNKIQDSSKNEQQLNYQQDSSIEIKDLSELASENEQDSQQEVQKYSELEQIDEDKYQQDSSSEILLERYSIQPSQASFEQYSQQDQNISKELQVQHSQFNTNSSLIEEQPASPEQLDYHIKVEDCEDIEIELKDQMPDIDCKSILEKSRLMKSNSDGTLSNLSQSQLVTKKQSIISLNELKSYQYKYKQQLQFEEFYQELINKNLCDNQDQVKNVYYPKSGLKKLLSCCYSDKPIQISKTNLRFLSLSLLKIAVDVPLIEKVLSEIWHCITNIELTPLNSNLKWSRIGYIDNPFQSDQQSGVLTLLLVLYMIENSPKLLNQMYRTNLHYKKSFPMMQIISSIVTQVVEFVRAKKFIKLQEKQENDNVEVFYKVIIGMISYFYDFNQRSDFKDIPRQMKNVVQIASKDIKRMLKEGNSVIVNN